MKDLLLDELLACKGSLTLTIHNLHCYQYQYKLSRYGSASMAITSSKKIMMILPLPFLLCTCQFLIATLIVGTYSRTTKSYRPLNASSRVLVYQISLSYTFGFIFTNIAFSLGKSFHHLDFSITLKFQLI